MMLRAMVAKSRVDTKDKTEMRMKIVSRTLAPSCFKMLEGMDEHKGKSAYSCSIASWQPAKPTASSYGSF
jgi:hypothetical protein